MYTLFIHSLYDLRQICIIFVSFKIILELFVTSSFTIRATFYLPIIKARDKNAVLYDSTDHVNGKFFNPFILSARFLYPLKT